MGQGGEGDLTTPFYPGTVNTGHEKIINNLYPGCRVVSTCGIDHTSARASCHLWYDRRIIRFFFSV